MRIAIDIRPLRDVMTGIGRYLYKTIEALATIDRQNEYLLFWSNLKRPIPPGLPGAPNFRQISYRFPGKALTALWAYTNFPAAEFFSGKIDVFYAPGFQVPPTKDSARIFTIYDLIPLTHPEWTIPSAVRHVRPRIRHYTARADVIVTISRASANDIIENLGVPEDRIVIAYPGTTVIPKVSESEISRLHQKYGLRKDFILFVSRLDPRKNLARLFLAFEQTGLAKDFDLVIAGPKGWHMGEMMRTLESVTCKEAIRRIDYIKDDELAALYNGAAFLAFPSLFEGFGLPILEAMSIGCPVLTSDISSMPEAAGEAALYVNPYEIDSISDGLIQLAGDSDLRAKLSKAGLAQAGKFTWEKTAGQMIGAFGKAFDIRGKA